MQQYMKEIILHNTQYCFNGACKQTQLPEIIVVALSNQLEKFLSKVLNKNVGKLLITKN